MYVHRDVEGRHLGLWKNELGCNVVIALSKVFQKSLKEREVKRLAHSLVKNLDFFLVLNKAKNCDFPVMWEDAMVYYPII